MRYRADLPPLPHRMLGLPVQHSMPVPYFCAEVESGRYDFRYADSNKRHKALKHRLCWICGQPLIRTLTFVIGPMSIINRTTSELPSHRECAEWAVKVCPFLLGKQDGYRETNKPQDLSLPTGGVLRQPDITITWQTLAFRPFQAGDDILIEIGPPSLVKWWRNGRLATRGEARAGLASAALIIRDMATEEGPEALEDYKRAYQQAVAYLPTGSE